MRGHRSLRLAAGLGLAALVLVCGCESPQQVARVQATQRWNTARAAVKLRLAADQLKVGNAEGAAAELAEADRLTPDSTANAALRARIWLAQGRVTEAAGMLAKATQEAGADAELFYLLGTARQQEQRWEDARAAFDRAVELNERELAYLVAAVEVRLLSCRPDEALALLAGQADTFGWMDAYRAALAECYEQLGRWSEAAMTWRGLAAAQTADSAVQERLAEALHRAGRYGEAVELLEELALEAGLVAAAPDAGAASEAWRRGLLADCYLALQRPAAARKEIEPLLQRDEHSPRVLLLLARVQAAEGAFGTALETARRAAAGAPENTAAQELVAALAWRTGQAELALSVARALAAQDRDNPVARRILAQVP